MVTKTEVRNYYANKHDLRDLDIEEKICPHVVIEWLNSISEDDIGIYWPATELFVNMDREYATMDEVKESIKIHIQKLIKDLDAI